MKLSSFYAHSLALGLTLAAPLVASESQENIPEGWKEIKPGGETSCARGDEFSFFVAPGTNPNVVIDYIGGGACWNAQNCSKEGSTFTDSTEEVRQRYRDGLTGIYDRKNANNPLKDWTHVVIPYCTGDIHWGSRDVNYEPIQGEPFTIKHRGAINSQVVMDWVKSNVSSPEKVLVTGCSAGAYGSIYWAPHYRKLFPQAHVLQFADSGAGVITEEFFQTSFPNWNTTEHAARWVPGIDPDRTDWLKLNLVDFYKGIAEFYPDMPLSQFSRNNDDIQTFFFEIMGGRAELWAPIMLQSFKTLRQDVPGFQYYLSAGTDHCILPYESFYSEQSQGVKFVDWFQNMIDLKPTGSVMCENCDKE